MKIQKSGMTGQVPVKVTMQKKEMGPKEEITLGSTEKNPDFLSKPLISQQAFGEDGSCNPIMQAATTVGGAAGGGLLGAIEAGIGWGASALGGEAGGLAATLAIGGIAAGAGGLATLMTRGNKGKMAAVGAAGVAASAGATYLGVRFGPMGMLYGSLVMGVPTAIVGNRLFSH